MARPKKVVEEGVVEEVVATPEVVPTPIAELSVDYPSEGLNNIARTVNELVRKVNGL
jgi:hypothetical protein